MSYPQARHTVVSFVVLLVSLCCIGFAAGADGAVAPGSRVSADVDVFVGTDAHGHTFPGATLPSGLVQLSPDTRQSGWDGCSGYHYSDNEILGFSHTHLSGTGEGELGDILLMPVAGELSTPMSTARYKSRFQHDAEHAAPGYYQVQLERYGIGAELTVTPRTGYHRYRFPPKSDAHVIVDLVHGINHRLLAAGVHVQGDRIITGSTKTIGWGGKPRCVYFALEASEPWQSVTLEADGKNPERPATEVRGKQVRAGLNFGVRPNGRPIVLRVGISFVSEEGARRNLNAEGTTWSFDEIRDRAQSTWESVLSRVRIETGNRNWRQTFYTALYHSLLHPSLFSDADGTHLGSDGTVHRDAFDNYTVFSCWDTFRAVHPLFTLVRPEVVDDFVQSLVAFAERSPIKSLPMWQLGNFDTDCMVGYHAVSVVTEAYLKGFRGFDAERAFQAARGTALGSRHQQDVYQRLGFVPWGLPRGRAATARTLEYATDDWGIAEMAKAMGRADDAVLFAERALSYRRVWDPTNRLFRSKRGDGSYQEPFNPREVSKAGNVASGYYIEANAWQYAFGVQHDVPGMIDLYGGKAAFVSRLDEFFNQDSDIEQWLVDVTGLIGQYAHGNEPCHHVAYLYALAGAQYKTAQRVRQIMLSLYDNTPEGLCGNDDCGQMSAWYVFSALGLYPVNPMDGRYIIGSPLVAKATIKLDPRFAKGREFTVTAANCSRQNLYVKSARLNGRPLERPWVTHAEIMAGGTIELEMTTLPHKALWAGAGSSE